MKWARVIKNPTGEILKPGDQDHKNDLISFRDFATEEELKSVLECEENQWAHYKFSYDYGQRIKKDFKELVQKNNTEFQKILPVKVKEYIESFKKRYEALCGGYLFFYDERVRYGTIDHIIYFKWEVETDKKGNTEFSVILYLSPKPEKKRRINSSPKQKTNTLIAQEYSSGGGGTVDPPQPPPPPPPSLH